MTGPTVLGSAAQALHLFQSCRPLSVGCRHQQLKIIQQQQAGAAGHRLGRSRCQHSGSSLVGLTGQALAGNLRAGGGGHRQGAGDK